MWLNSGLPRRTSVAIAPPRYPVSNSAPKTDVRGTRYTEANELDQAGPEHGTGRIAELPRSLDCRRELQNFDHCIEGQEKRHDTVKTYPATSLFFPTDDVLAADVMYAIFVV